MVGINKELAILDAGHNNKKKYKAASRAAHKVTSNWKS